MKRLLICSLILSFILALGIPATLAAQPGPVQKHARYVIHRTAVVLVAAQKAALKGGDYAGLGRAVAHQNHARKLFRDGFYVDAIYHSLRARAIAADVITRNKADLVAEARLDTLESRYAKKSPPDQDLDLAIKVKIDDDHTAAKLQIELDI